VSGAVVGSREFDMRSPEKGPRVGRREPAPGKKATGHPGWAGAGSAAVYEVPPVLRHPPAPLSASSPCDRVPPCGRVPLRKKGPTPVQIDVCLPNQPSVD
jgi:hypothetical protein